MVLVGKECYLINQHLFIFKENRMTEIKIQDRKLNYVLAKADVVEIIKTYFPDWDGRMNVMCPFHNDTKPSLNITLEGKAMCYGCNWSATNLVSLVATMEGITYLAARDLLYKQIANIIPHSKPANFARRLGVKAYAYAQKERGLSQEVIGQYLIGYDPNTERITVPVLDQFMECVNIRYLGWTKEQRAKNKAYNDKGHGNARLYPEWKMVDEDVIILVEGEWDCLIGRAHGLPTVTWTGGAGAWDSSYNWMFKNKHVLILYDADKAGQEGADYALNQISKVARCEIVADPSKWLMTNEGKDLSDWLRSSKHEFVVGVLSDIVKARKNEMNKPKPNLCPCCGGIIPKEKT